MKKWWATILRIAVGVYIGLMIVLAAGQRRMIYYPRVCAEAEAVWLAERDGLKPWRTAAGELVGWQPVAAAAERDAMLLFHGNAGCAVQRGYFVQGFAAHLDVFVMEYPGYGSRTGRPSERAFIAAGTEALRQLRRERTGRIYLGGESLGTGGACRLAGENPDVVSGLFLSTPFTRLADVARHHYPFLPMGVLLRDRYENVTHLKRFHGPVAVLLAECDEVVPASLGQRLAETYRGPRRIWVQAGRSHNDMDYRRDGAGWKDVADFLQAGDYCNTAPMSEGPTRRW